MDHVEPRPTRRRWKLAHLALPITAAAVIAALPMTAPPRRAAPAWTPLTPVHVAYARAAAPTTAQLLSFNDFHGDIDPPTGSGGLVNGVPAGGVEYLATAVKKLRAVADEEYRPSLTVGAGDLIGGTPLVSAAFHDEPAIEALNAARAGPVLGRQPRVRRGHRPSCCASRTAAATRPTAARTVTASPARRSSTCPPTWSTRRPASRCSSRGRSAPSAASRSASSE